MLSNSEFGGSQDWGTVEDPFKKIREAHKQRSTTPTSLAPHAAGYFSTADKILSMPSQGLTPMGSGALKGSFAFKQTAFD
jgi:hypothetical protein